MTPIPTTVSNLVASILISCVANSLSPGDGSEPPPLKYAGIYPVINIAEEISGSLGTRKMVLIKSRFYQTLYSTLPIISCAVHYLKLQCNGY